MKRRFVVITGLPGSGKSHLARQLAPALDLPVLDKDDWLERAFDAKGIGDAAWRRQLSRMADDDFRRAAEESRGAILVSFWHQTGMPADSGTPTQWLSALNAHLVTLHCSCPVEHAAERFRQRTRHAGHLDAERRPAELLEQFRFLASLDPAIVGPTLTVPTTAPVEMDPLCERIRSAWAAT